MTISSPKATEPTSRLQETPGQSMSDTRSYWCQKGHNHDIRVSDIAPVLAG